MRWITLFFASLCFSSAVWAQPHSEITLNIINLTPHTHTITGHEADTLSDNVSIEPRQLPTLLPTKTPKEVKLHWRLGERGHMHRFKYLFASDKTSCLLDFVIRWNVQKASYEVANIHTTSSDDVTICPHSDPIITKNGRHSEFTVVILETKPSGE